MSKFFSGSAVIAAAFALVSCANSSPAEKTTLSLSETAQSHSNQTVWEKFDMQRCVNMGNSFEVPRKQRENGGGRIDKEDFALIKSKGFDTIRLPVKWSDYTGPAPDFTLDPTFSNTVKAYVDEALSQNLNVILNIHHFDEINETPAAEMDRLVSIWKQVGALFKGYPDDLWFETLNEPNNQLKGDIMRQSQALAIKAIRIHHPDRIVILGGEFWSNWRQLDTNMVAPDSNIVFTFHYYEPFDFTHYKAEWTKPDMPNTLRSWGNQTDKAELAEAMSGIKRYKVKTGQPLFLGEFGVYTSIKNEDRVKWVDAVRREMEAAEIPWCLWAYANTFPIYNYESGKWDKDMLDALGLE